jgi:hypothetical protein
MNIFSLGFSLDEGYLCHSIGDIRDLGTRRARIHHHRLQHLGCCVCGGLGGVCVCVRVGMHTRMFV